MQAFAHATSIATTTSGPRAYANGRRAMRITLAATYPFFFVSSLASRLNPFGATAARPSLLAETRARAAAVIPFIFMG